MKISILSVGTKMPKWVNEGVGEYEKRMPRELSFSFQEIPLAKRAKSSNISQCIQKEGQAMLAKLKSSDYVVALEINGKSIDTAGLAKRLDNFQQDNQNLTLLIGGPDGLGKECLARASEQWSLSSLTLPHPLVRVLLAEQLYRAWSILNGHPYHRE
jgi:23S rRNA (pseudouridine1915-N3)-methyltransferase